MYFGIGYTYWTYINIGFKNKEECIIKAEQYASKIFELDADSIYGHRLLGIINLRRSMLQQSVISAKKALLHDPNDSETIVWLGTAYCNVGKTYAAKPLAERIVKIDPFNPFGQVVSAWIDFLEGHFSHGLKKIEIANNMIPGHPVLRVLLGLFLAANKRKEEAFSVLDRLVKDNPDNLWSKMGQCLKYALIGDREKTIRAMSGGVKDKARCDLYDAQLMAECDSLIGEKDEAINSLEYAVDLGAINYPFNSEIDPFLENIRGEERFKKLMERVKHEWENFEV